MIDLDAELPGIMGGDTESFSRWMAGAERPLRLSLRRFDRSVDTEAVMQETLLRIWTLARRCESDGRPNSLLRFAITIGRNLALSEIRRRRETPIENGAGDSPDPPTPDPPAPDPGPPDPFLRERIMECLEKLPAKPKAAIGARLESGGAEPDLSLADLLGMRLNTFLQNITRARRLLAQCLQQSGIEVA